MHARTRLQALYGGIEQPGQRVGDVADAAHAVGHDEHLLRLLPPERDCEELVRANACPKQGLGFRVYMGGRGSSVWYWCEPMPFWGIRRMRCGRAK